MENEKQIGDALLEANGIEAGHVSQQELDTLRGLLAKHKRSLRFVKWCACACSGLFVLLLPLTIYVGRLAARKPGGTTLEVVLVALEIVLLYGAIAYSVSYIVRGWNVNRLEAKETLARIEMKLEEIARREKG